MICFYPIIAGQTAVCQGQNEKYDMSYLGVTWEKDMFVLVKGGV
jgi:hypothetical protein